MSQQNPPNLSGGGTVFYVTQNSHRFLSNRVERYEGGTPNVLGIWRLGLVWKYKQRLKKMMPPGQSLVDYEIKRAGELQAQLKQIPNLLLLDGLSDSPKLPVFSFLIKCGDRFLHYNYVCALLNDLFGIQSRGGCQCAGPYAQMMLGMLKHNQAVEQWLVHAKDELLRPGVSRFSLPVIGTTLEQQEYVINAIKWVAKNGWKFMHVYRCNHRTGEWRHKSRPGAPLGKTERRWLSHFDPMKALRKEADPSQVISMQEALDNANDILRLVLKDQSSISQALKMTEESDDSILRWYVYPKEVAAFVQQGLDVVPGTESRNQLTGALRPIAWYGEETSPVEEKSISLYRFREGEHTGEAPLDEIQDGYSDGELSDSCQIYATESDSWVLISTFLKSQSHTITTPNSSKEEINQTEEERLSLDQDAVTDTSSTKGAILASSNEIAEEEKTDVLTSQDVSAVIDIPVVEKHERKKPSRDSSTWGQGVKVALQPTSALSDKIDSTGSRKREKSKHIKPPAKLMRLVTQAMIQWDMIEDGDRLLLGLSGGKDSMSLLHILLEFQKKLPTRFEIEVCTVDPLTPSFDPSPLIPYVESLGLKYHYIKDEIVERAMSAGKDGKMVTSLCAFCARMKRGNLYACARRNNCNKLVLAQHVSKD